MSIESVVGRSYGPFPFPTDRSVVSAYVTATGDDPSRWDSTAPRALAGALLFSVAPALLGDPDVSSLARSVIHGEQTFNWVQPIPIDTELSVTGTVTRIRERGGVYFVGFEMKAGVGDREVVAGTSMFLMSADAPPAGGSGEESEPRAEAGSSLEPAVDAPPVDDELVPLPRSVSRADLVRYAAASRDFNPIHWDHEAAVAAGLPGVVAHGLLQSAWLTQAVERAGASPVSARFRYRSPLRPDRLVTGVGARSGTGWETRLISQTGEEHVVGTFVV